MDKLSRISWGIKGKYKVNHTTPIEKVVVGV